MKFRNPKTGEEFDIRTGTEAFCKDKVCDTCAMCTACPDGFCAEWANDHPAEAARRMGFEVVEGSAAVPAEQPIQRRAAILDAAKACVCGGRDGAYGAPENNFALIARLWNAYLGRDVVDAADVAMLMALLKIARIRTGTAAADSFVDLAGYAACGGELRAGEG